MRLEHARGLWWVAPRVPLRNQKLRDIPVLHRALGMPDRKFDNKVIENLVKARDWAESWQLVVLCGRWHEPGESFGAVSGSCCCACCR